MTDAEFIARLRRVPDPSLSDVQHLLELVRAGDVVHVGETGVPTPTHTAARAAIAPLLRDLDAIARNRGFGA
jgi:hypothetical protein